METTLWSCGFHIIFQIWNFRTQETSPVSEMFSMTLNLHVQNMMVKTYLNKGELGACKNHSRIITIDWLTKIDIVVRFWCLSVVLLSLKISSFNLEKINAYLYSSYEFKFKGGYDRWSFFIHTESLKKQSSMLYVFRECKY